MPCLYISSYVVFRGCYFSSHACCFNFSQGSSTWSKIVGSKSCFLKKTIAYVETFNTINLGNLRRLPKTLFFKTKKLFIIENCEVKKMLS